MKSNLQIRTGANASLNEETEFEKGVKGPKEPDELMGSDPYENYKDNIIQSKEEIRKTFHQDPKTILDETVGSVMNKTLSFLTYSGDSYLKKVYEAESILDIEDKEDNDLTWKQTASKYGMGIALFCRDSDNAIYLGIVLIFVSLIIYFLSIVSPVTNGTHITDSS
jgi:hypothetical protein